MIKGSRWRDWVFALVLYVPVALLYIAHFGAELVDPDHIGTGFIQYDQPSYMASSREFIDGSSTGFAYALPREPHYDARPTVVQLHLWALSIPWRITGIDPGLLFVLFGALFGILATRVFLLVFDQCVPVQGALRRWGQALFVWGGGLFCLAGGGYAYLKGFRGMELVRESFTFDPAYGWWFMNLGRNLIYPNEAYYHFMFFMTLLLLMRSKFVWAALITFILAWSHPFAGVGLLVIVATWALMERFFVRNRTVPAWFILALIITGVTFAYYLFVWIPARASDDLVSSIKVPWTISILQFGPAYVIVAAMALFRLRSPQRTIAFMASPAMRLLMVMVVINFMLENHEFAVTPHQPVHFTRGYVWSALFLIGAPWLLNEAWPWIRFHGQRWALLVAGTFVCFFLADNFVFMTMHGLDQIKGRDDSYWLSRDSRSVLTELDNLFKDNELLVSQDLDLGHLAQAYTPYRTYCAHFYSLEEKQRWLPPLLTYFHDNAIADPLLNGPLMVVSMVDSGAFVPSGNAQLIYQNDTYRLYRVAAAGQAGTAPSRP